MKLDYHMHFEYGSYDLEWVQGFFESAKKNGVGEIGISEHSHGFIEFKDLYYEELILDDSLGLQAKSNTIENFKFGFEDKFMDTTISRMEQNQDIFTKMMNDKEFGNIVRDYMLKKVYQQLRK